MSTQATPGATPMFKGKFGIEIRGFSHPNHSSWFVLGKIFPRICVTPHSSLRFESCLHFKLKTQFCGIKPHGVAT